MGYDPTAALNNLLTRKQAIAVELAGLVGGASPNGAPGSMPNASGGGSIDHVGYRKSLYDELAQIDLAIQTLQGPFEILQQGMT